MIKMRQKFCSSWWNNFARAMKDKRVFSLSTTQFYFLEQAIFSATTLSMFNEKDVKILDNRFNYPLENHFALEGRVDHLYKLVIMHYHDCFETMDWIELFQMPDEFREWIDEFLPFKEIKTPIRSRLKKITYFQIHKLKYKYNFMKQ